MKAKETRTSAIADLPDGKRLLAPVEADGAPEGGGDQSDVRARLREDTINCVLVPGQRLKLDELRVRYGVSVGSLREALPQLVAEGLVVAEANRGFCVAPVSLADLNEITDLRVDLERKALALAIKNGDDEWEAGIIAAHHMMTKITAAVDSPPNRRTSNERHARFHDALVAACPSALLLRFRSLLFDQSQRYRSLSLQRSTSPGRLDEHRALMGLVLQRDVDGACNLIEGHIRKTAENVQGWLAEHRDP